MLSVLLSAYACAPGSGLRMGSGLELGPGHGRGRSRRHRVHAAGWPAGDRGPALDGRRAVAVRVRVRIAGPSRTFYGPYLSWQWMAYRAARVSPRRFDVVHYVTLGSVHGGSHLWRLGRPFVLGPLGGGQKAPAPLRSELARGRRHDLLRTLALRSVRINPVALTTARNAAVVLVTNRNTQDLLSLAGCARCPAVPRLGSPCRAARAGERSDCCVSTAGAVGGRLNPHKGVRIALSAVARARQHIPVRLTIAGDGPLRDDLRRWIAELGLQRDVEWNGSVPLPDLCRLYERSDVMLFTSIRDSLAGWRQWLSGYRSSSSSTREPGLRSRRSCAQGASRAIRRPRRAPRRRAP